MGDLMGQEFLPPMTFRLVGSLLEEYISALGKGDRPH